MWPGRPYPLGATYDGTGTNFALFSEVAERVELCLIADDGTETRVDLTEVDAFVWHGYVPAVRPGSGTGTACTARTTRRRASAATRTSCCSTRTPRRSTGRSTATRRCTPTTFDDPDDAQRRRTRPAHTMTSVVVNPYFDWGHDRPPQHEYHETVIYEAHVHGLTMQHPAVPEELRGTYAGLAHPAVIEHLTSLGRHRGRAHAGAPVRQRPVAGGEGPVQLLGLQHHRLLRAAQRLLRLRPAAASRCRSSRRWSRRCTPPTSR